MEPRTKTKKNKIQERTNKINITRKCKFGKKNLRKKLIQVRHCAKVEDYSCSLKKARLFVGGHCFSLFSFGGL